MQAGSAGAATPSTHTAPVTIHPNRRHHPRYPCEGKAEVFVPHGALLFGGEILDLSYSGCFVETPGLDLERGTPVEVSFVAHQMRFRVAGKIAVIYARRGAGIAFEKLSQRRARQIGELIEELKEAAPKPAVQSGADTGAGN